jgi:Flp pilus assembly secretin CpaC
VCERLTQHAEVDASEIDIQVSNGDVTLTGSVDDRNQKRMAEDIAENISGVREVHNQLRVSKGLGQRMGEALGLSGGREEDRTAGTTTTTGRQNQPTTTRR